MVPSRPECQSQEAQLVLLALQAQAHPKHHRAEKNELDTEELQETQFINTLTMLDIMWQLIL